MNSNMYSFETTHDSFFAGKLTIAQPKKGFRAGLDSLLLAACINVSNDAKILELGSGAGVAAIALAHRIKAHITGIEIDPELVNLANHNAHLNSMNPHVKFLQGDATTPKTFSARGQDVVMFNPPFYHSETRQSSPNAQKAKSTHLSDEHLSAWVRTAIICLKSGGEFASIIPPERLQIMLAAIGAQLGVIEILPIHSKPSLPALRLIIRGKKGRKTPLKLLPAFYTQDKNGVTTAKMQEIAENGGVL